MAYSTFSFSALNLNTFTWKQNHKSTKENCVFFFCLPTCLFIQSKQTGHVTRNHVVGDLSEPAGVSVGGDNVEDLCAGLRVAADAHGVLVRVEHWSVVVQVLHLNVHVGLSAQASLTFEK